MKNVSTLMDKAERPIRAVQFGTGNFLRAFADWMLEIVNEKTDDRFCCLLFPIRFWQYGRISHNPVFFLAQRRDCPPGTPLLFP